MGGINCGGGGGNIAPEFSAEYVEQLASYCKSLFDGSAKFFEANVAIEDAVLTGSDLTVAVQLLSDSEGALMSARAMLGTVAALVWARRCRWPGRLWVRSARVQSGLRTRSRAER